MRASSPEYIKKNCIKTLEVYTEHFKESDTVEDLTDNMADLIAEIADINSSLADTAKVYPLEAIDED